MLGVLAYRLVEEVLKNLKENLERITIVAIRI